MRKVIPLLMMSFMMTGCATQSLCRYPVERDLTTTWQERHYWCAPPSYKKQIPQRITPLSKVSNNDGVKNKPVSNTIDYTVVFSKDPEVVREGISNTHTQNVSFYRHDSEFSRDDLTALYSLKAPLKVRGCRLTSEPSFLNFSRALRVRNELKKIGFPYKITILADNSCTGSKKVEVRS